MAAIREMSPPYNTPAALLIPSVGTSYMIGQVTEVGQVGQDTQAREVPKVSQDTQDTKVSQVPKQSSTLEEERVQYKNLYIGTL